ncbi:MAG: Ig domain-containing protein, partial [Bacteroidota bacterium]|nr:Ig domain-containing protein [Bacteroidota bacterium]
MHPISAQLLQNITARELLPQVEAKAKNDLGNDAFPTNVLFAAVDYQGIGIRMDLSSGKATGWVYRWYAPSIDSAELLLAVKPLVGGPFILPLGTDTISRSLPFNVGTTPLIEPWVDSPEALDGSKSGGGASFIQRHPDARMALAVLLRNPAPTPNLPIGEYWLFMYTAADDTLTCLVYADSGDPLRCLSNKAPVITTLPRTIATVGELYTYDVDARGEPNPVFVLERSPSGMMIDSASGVISWVPAEGQEGLHDVSILAVNVHGSDRQEFQVQVRGGTMAPKITSSPVTEVHAGEIYVYTLAAAGTPTPTFELTRGPKGMILEAGRGILTWQPSRAESGEHDVEIVARNAVGSDTQRFVLTVVSEPRLEPIADQTTSVGNLFSIRAVADGYPAPVYALVIAPAGMTVDSMSGVIAWIPSVRDTG